MSWRVGDEVEAEFEGIYYDARIIQRLPGYRYVVEWADDSSVTKGMPANMMRPRSGHQGSPGMPVSSLASSPLGSHHHQSPPPPRPEGHLHSPMYAAPSFPATPPDDGLEKEQQDMPRMQPRLQSGARHQSDAPASSRTGSSPPPPPPPAQARGHHPAGNPLDLHAAFHTQGQQGGREGVGPAGFPPRRRHTIGRRRQHAVRALTGSETETPHYSLIKALSAVQLKRGRFLSHFVDQQGAVVDLNAFTLLFEGIFRLGEGVGRDAKATLTPPAGVQVLADAGAARAALIQRVFHFFDFDSDGTISADELTRFAQAPLAGRGTACTAPKHIFSEGGGRVVVPYWKRELWDEVLKETQSALLRALGLNVNADISRSLARMWRKTPYISHEAFDEDTRRAGLELSTKQRQLVFEVADSMGHDPPTVDTALVLQYCTLDPDIGTDSSFPITFTENQHRRANDQIGLVIYLPFLLLFTFFIISDKGLRNSAWVHEGVSDLFLDEEYFEDNSGGAYFKKVFWDIGSLDEFWEWAEGPLVTGFWNDNRGANRLQFSNAPIGALKFRQKRVRLDTCEGQQHLFENGADMCAPVGSDAHNLRVSEFNEEKCFPDWQDGSEETQDYNATTNDGSPRAWSDRFGVERNITIQGPWTYGTCAFLNEVLAFGANKTEVAEKLSMLKQGQWIDDQTRLIIATFFTYNTNLRLFTRFEFAVEFSAGGALIPTAVSRPFRLFDWRTHPFVWSFFLCIYFVTLFMFIIWFVKRLGMRVYRKHVATGFGIFKSYYRVLVEHPWFLYDMANYMVFIVTTSIRFEYMNRGLTNASIICLDSFPQEYDSLSSLVHFMSILDAINALLTYGRVFYFLRLNNNINVFLRTLHTAFFDILAIIVIFFIVFLAFSLAGHIVYGHVLVSYRDLFTTFSTLSRALIGDFNYEEMRESRRVFSPMFMVGFVVCCVVVLFNLIIAVLTDAYADVKNSNWESKEFVQKARHDPAVSLPPQSMRTALGASSLTRELKMHLCCHSDATKRGNPRVFWKDYLHLFYRLERGTPDEIVRAAICLIQLEYAADPRISVTSRSERDTVPVSVGLGGSAQYRVESVLSFLKRQLGGWHTLVSYERMLIKIPCMQLGVAESVLWRDLLEYHHHWQRSVSSYTRFDLPMEDRLSDIHNMLCGPGGTYENGEWNKHAACSLFVTMHHYLKFIARDVNRRGGRGFGGIGKELVDLSSSSESSDHDPADHSPMAKTRRALLGGLSQGSSSDDDGVPPRPPAKQRGFSNHEGHAKTVSGSAFPGSPHTAHGSSSGKPLL